MTPTPAKASDLAARWRPLTDQEAANAAVFLDDAWALLVGRRPMLPTWVAAGLVDPANVTRVLCSIVLRVLKNPDGFVSESIDDWSGSRNPLAADGGLRVTADELADVTPSRMRRRSIRLVVYGNDCA